MNIDIISYTDAQYAALTEEQILEVQAAQLKKNALDLKLSEDITKEKYRLIDNGIFRSEIWALVKAKLEEEHAQEVENIRDGLLFYLRFSAKPEEEITSAPYTVDYSLTVEERLGIVRTYYMETYEDPSERFQAFKADTLARSYLGELYAPLYDYFFGLI